MRMAGDKPQDSSSDSQDQSPSAETRLDFYLREEREACEMIRAV
jgi:hypothetical protein